MIAITLGTANPRAQGQGHAVGAGQARARRRGEHPARHRRRHRRAAAGDGRQLPGRDDPAAYAAAKLIHLIFLRAARRRATTEQHAPWASNAASSACRTSASPPSSMR